VRRRGSTLVYTIGALLLFEAGARYATRPSVLLSLNIESYPTAYAHREKLSKETPNVPLVVLGDSTATRGINSCQLAPKGINLAFPSGGMREATALLATQAPATAVYAINPLNISIYSEWVTPTFADLSRRNGLAAAVLGSVSTLYGKREATTAVLTALVSPVQRRKNREIFERETICGRETTATPKVPDEREQAEQVRRYGQAWLQLFLEAATDSAVDTLSASLIEWRAKGWYATVVLTPLRADFRAFLDKEYPDLRERKRKLWRTVTERASVTFVECDEAVPDRSLYDDPIHLNELGRRAFTECLAEELKGATRCCRPRGK